ncbi:MAG: hypothetical protein R3F62_00465 [Planctomycetota bacterium]
MEPKNSFLCFEFDPLVFTELVLQHSGAPAGSPANTQVDYLARYLDEDLIAKSMLVESHYIDRHFMEEVSLYYSSCFHWRTNACSRLHLFNNEVTTHSLKSLVHEAAKGELEAQEQAKLLEQQYLGFVVVRPLPSVPIGRTVLRPLEDDSARHFPTRIPYTVHLLGLELRVWGLAFQQQDSAVAACATTSVWTALQRVCRYEGERTPTPSAIAQVGVGYVPPAGRVLPSRGLTNEAMFGAFRAYGYSSVPFDPAEDPSAFKLLLNIYLRSGIPVVLTTKGRTGHAVTVVGYRKEEVVPEWNLNKVWAEEGPPEGGDTEAPLDESEEPEEASPCGGDSLPILAHNLAYERIYVHDDRLGPYARARLVEVDPVTLEIEIEFPDNTVEKTELDIGLAPLYAKARLTGSQLLEAAGLLYPWVNNYLEQVLGEERRGLELFFERSGNYLASLYARRLDAERMERFMGKVSLSRYVGIVRICSESGVELLDLVLDTTDILREDPFDPLVPILAVVALDPSAQPAADGVSANTNILAG